MAKHQIKQQTKEMVKHRLNDNKVTCQRWRNTDKTDDKTSHLTMILRIKVG